MSNRTLLHGVRIASLIIVRRNGILLDCSIWEVWFSTVQQWSRWVASPIWKIQTNVRSHFKKWINPSQHIDLFNKRTGKNILYFSGLNINNRKKYNTVSNKFEAHFVKWRNPIYESVKFNMRRQKEESISSFITSLNQLTEHWNYHDLHDEMVWDRIVVGLWNSNLSERLQTDLKLTLDKAIMTARQTEDAREQQSKARGETDNTSTRI